MALDGTAGIGGGHNADTGNEGSTLDGGDQGISDPQTGSGRKTDPRNGPIDTSTPEQTDTSLAGIASFSAQPDSLAVAFTGAIETEKQRLTTDRIQLAQSTPFPGVRTGPPALTTPKPVTETTVKGLEQLGRNLQESWGHLTDLIGAGHYGAALGNLFLGRQNALKSVSPPEPVRQQQPALNDWYDAFSPRELVTGQEIKDALARRTVSPGLADPTQQMSGAEEERKPAPMPPMADLFGTPTNGPFDPDEEPGQPSPNVEKNVSELRRNLMKAGRTPRPGEEAHHIVAFEHRFAAPARAVLQRYGIGINQAENGVFLTGPARGATKDFFAFSHRGSGLHSKDVLQSINARMSMARSRQDALDILNSIRQDILRGIKP